MRAPARWYLAVLGMFSLCLLAAHFAVQEHVQRNMRQAVRGWLAQSGGSVNHVRYHLLRGVLTLEGVHWADEAAQGLRLDVARVSIITSSRAMASPSPSFQLLRLARPVLSLPRAALLAWLHGDADNAVDAMGGLLAHARLVSLGNMELRVLPDAGAGKPVMLLQDLDGVLTDSGMRIGGILDAGVFQLSARLTEGGLTGRLDLRGVPFASLAQFLGHAAPATEVVGSGDLTLSGNWGRRDVGLRGRLDLQDDKAEASIDLHAGWSKTGGHLDMQCNNVLLTGLPVDWPAFAGRKLTDGRLSGLLHMDRKWTSDDWQIGMDGSLAGLTLASPQLPAWHIGSVKLGHAVLLPATGMLSAAQMQVSDADLPFDAGSMPAGAAMGPTPQIDSLTLQHIRPQLRFADGSELAIPDLAGSGKIGPVGHVSLSTQQGQAKPTDPEAGEVWKLVVDGDVYADWRARVRASHVPLVRLRPLLPGISLPGQQGVPDYGGSAGFSLQLKPSPQGLQVAGNAVLQDVIMTQGGDQLTAAHVEVGIADAAGGGRRKLSRVDIRDWQYQMALHPLGRLAQPAASAVPAALQGSKAPAAVPAAKGDGAQAKPAEPPADKLPVDARSAPAWEVDEISAQNGRISLGQPDALIADGLQFAVHHLASGKMAAFTMSGKLGEGNVLGHGHVQLQPAYRMTVKAEIRNALPFVFNDWMQLSGMPRFVRGRLNADLLITAVHAAPSAYKGRLHLRMYQAVLEDGTYPDDPLSQRVGYSMPELLARLGSTRRARLAMTFHGDWQGATLGDTIGDATLAALKQAADKAVAKSPSSEPPVVKITRLRLQGKHGLSLNERSRLRGMARELWRDRKLIVELTPKLGNEPLDADLIARVRHTQRVAERYLRRLGIPASRIYPVWPQASQPHGDAPGLLLRARHS